MKRDQDNERPAVHVCPGVMMPGFEHYSIPPYLCDLEPVTSLYLSFVIHQREMIATPTLLGCWEE